MRRAVVIGGVLVLGLAGSGCLLSVSEPGSVEATLTTGAYHSPTNSSNWTACAGVDGCRFRGSGINEGPGCVAQVRGNVRFTGRDGRQIVDREGLQNGTTFEWAVVPEPEATIRPGESFDYRTVDRIPGSVVDGASTYTSFVMEADFRRC